MKLKEKIRYLKRYLGYWISYQINYPLVFPKELNFQVTNRCPLKCKMCNIWRLDAKPEEELSVQEMKRIVDECKALGIKYISFVGGEVLVRKEDVLDLIDYTNSKGINTTIVSNAHFLNRETCERLLDNGLNRLSLSLDGAKKQTHDFIRGTGNYDKVIESAKIMLELRNQNRTKVDFTTVIMNYNFKELTEIYHLGKEIGVDNLFYQALVLDNTFQNFDYNSKLWIKGKDLEELKKIIKDLIFLKRKDKDFIFNSVEYLRNIPKYFEGKEKFRLGTCLAGFMNLNIDPYGRISICGFGPNLNVKGRSIEDLWKDREYKKARLKIKRCKRPCLMLCYEKFGIKEMFEHLLS